MKRLILICILSSLLFGCNADDGANSPSEELHQSDSAVSTTVDKKTYQISTYYDEFSFKQTIFKHLADRKSEFANVTAHETMEHDAYIDKLLNQFLTGKQPDIVLGRPEIPVKELVSKGYIHDITDRVESNYSLMGEDASKTVMDALRIDGRYYGLPRGIADYYIYFNEFMLDDYDFEYRLDFTVDEFIDVCLAFKDKNPEVYLFPEPEFNSTTDFRLYINDGGIGQVLIDQLVVSDMEYFMNDGSPRFDSKDFIERLSKVKKLLKQGNWKPLSADVRNKASESVAFNSAYLKDVLMLPILRSGYGDELFYFDNTRFEGMNVPFGTYTGHRIFTGDFNFVTSSAQDVDVCEDMLVSYIMGYRSEISLSYLNVTKAKGMSKTLVSYQTGVDSELLNEHLKKEQLSQKGNYFLWITPPVTIIREACKDMLLNDISPEKTAETIQNKIHLYLMENL